MSTPRPYALRHPSAGAALVTLPGSMELVGRLIRCGDGTWGTYAGPTLETDEWVGAYRTRDLAALGCLLVAHDIRCGVCTAHAAGYVITARPSGTAERRPTTDRNRWAIFVCHEHARRLELTREGRPRDDVTVHPPKPDRDRWQR